MTALVTYPVLPAAEVDAARTRLRDDLHHLCTVVTRRIEFDDGTTRTVTAPPPLAQLEADLAGGSAPVGAFAPRSKPPLGIDALTVLAAIDRDTERPPTRERVGWLWDVGQQWASGPPSTVVDAARTVGGWRASVDAVLDPLPRFRVRGQACPSCGAVKVHDHTDHSLGEQYTRPALEVDAETGETRCCCCSATWAAEHHELLRQVLEQQQAETLAVDGADTAVRARIGPEAGVRWFDDPDPVRPGHAPDLSTLDPALRQCRARVPHPDPTRFRRRRRCHGLLDREGRCPNAVAHAWEPPDPDDEQGDETEAP